MNFFSSVVNFLIFMLFMRTLFIMATALRGAFLPKSETEPEASVSKSPLLKAMEESQEFEAVIDENCGVLVPKQEAYILALDDGPRYFCSWECRQEYMEKDKSKD